MKKELFLTVIFLLVLKMIGFAQIPAQKTTTGPHITFDNTIHDFGAIAYNSPGAHVFMVTNTGTEPLIIMNCVKGCGCKSVDWTKDPIKPGEKGMIKVVYNTKKIGHFSRGVDVYSNDSASPKLNIRLTGTVEVDPTAQPGTAASPVSTAPAATKTADVKWWDTFTKWQS